MYFCYLFLISSASIRSLLFLSFICAHLRMKCSFDISSFLEEISSLSHSIVYLYFFCIVHLRRHSYLSLLFSGTLHSIGYIFPFLTYFLLLFFPQLSVKPSQTTTLLSCISFSLGWFLSVTPVHCYEPLSIILQALCLLYLIPWIYSSPPLCNHRGFDLGHTRLI